MKRSFQVLDGSTATLSGPFPDLKDPGSTSFMVFRMDGGLQEFGSGGPDFAALDASRLAVRLTEKYTTRAHGTLRVGYAERVDPGTGLNETVVVGAWQGRVSSVRTVLYNRTSADVIALFDRFVIEETAEGPVMHARQPLDVTVDRSVGKAPSVIHNLSSMGLVDVVGRSRDVERHLPGVAGLRTPVGELFVHQSPQQTSLVSVGDTSLTYIVPDPKVPESRVIDAVSRLEVDWQAAP